MNENLIESGSNLNKSVASSIGSTISKINTNMSTFSNPLLVSANPNSDGNAQVETVDLESEMAKQSPIDQAVSTAANTSTKATVNLDALNNMTSKTATDITNNWTKFLLGTGPQAATAMDSILNSLTGIGLFNSAEASSISDAFRVDLAATASAGYAGATTLNQELTKGNVLTGLAKANETAMNEFANARNAGQIAQINAFDGTIAGGGDQSIARASGVTAGGKAFSDNFDSTKVMSGYGTAFGNAADTATNAGFRTTKAMMDSVDMQALKDINIPAADAVFGGAGTNYSNLIQLHEQNINNVLGTLGFNENGSWNGNVDVTRILPELLMEARDEIQNALYVPQIAYDSGANMFNRGYDTVINAKNKIRGYEDINPDDVHVYTSIGDSVESGFGLDQYNQTGVMVLQDANISGSAPDLVGKALGAETINQLHMPGARTNELLYILDDGALPDFVNKGIESSLSNGGYDIETLHAKRDQYIDAIKSSDVITLDIGMNDLWAPVVGAFYNIAQDGIDLTPGQTIVDNYENYGSFWTGANFMVKFISAIATNPDKWGYYVGNVGEGLIKWCTDYLINYPLIMLKIYELNPDATLCVVGGYNPIDDWDLIPGMDDNLAQYVGQAFYDVRDLTKRLWVGLYPGKAVYVDSRGTEIQADSTRFVSPTLNTEGYTPHPTYEGAKHQANGILGALGLDGLKYEEEDKGIYYNGKDDYEKVVNYHLQEDYVPAPFNQFTTPVQHALENGVTNFVQGMRRGDADKSLVWSGVQGASNLASNVVGQTSKFFGDVIGNSQGNSASAGSNLIGNVMQAGSNLIGGLTGQSGTGNAGTNLIGGAIQAGQNLIGGLTGQSGTGASSGTNLIGDAMSAGQNLIGGAMQAGSNLIGGLTGQSGTGNAGTNLIGGAIQAGQNLIGGLTGQSGTGASSGTNLIGDAMSAGQNLIGGAMQAGSNLIGGLTGQSGTGNAGTNLIGGALQTGQNLIGGLTGQSGNGASSGTNLIGDAMSAGQNLIGGAMQAGSNLIGGLTGQSGSGLNIGSAIQNGQTAIGGALQAGSNLINPALQTGSNLVGGLLRGTSNSGNSLIADVMDNAIASGQSFVNDLANPNGQMAAFTGNVLQTGQSLLNPVVQAGQSALGGLANSNVIGNAMQAGQALIGGVAPAGQNIATGLMGQNPSGISSGADFANSVTQAGTNIVNNIIDTGRNIGDKMTSGSQYFNNMVNGVSDGLTTINNGLSKGAQVANSGLAKGVEEAIYGTSTQGSFNPMNAVQGAITGATGALTGGIQAAQEGTKGAIEVGAGLFGNRILNPSDVSNPQTSADEVFDPNAPQTGLDPDINDNTGGGVAAIDEPTVNPGGINPNQPGVVPDLTADDDNANSGSISGEATPIVGTPGPGTSPVVIPEDTTGAADNTTPSGDTTGSISASDVAIQNPGTPGPNATVPEFTIGGTGNIKSVVHNYRVDMENGDSVYQNVKSGISVATRYLNGETIAGHSLATDSPEEIAAMVKDADKLYAQADSMGIKYDKAVKNRIENL